MKKGEMKGKKIDEEYKIPQDYHSYTYQLQ